MTPSGVPGPAHRLGRHSPRCGGGGFPSSAPDQEWLLACPESSVGVRDGRASTGGSAPAHRASALICVRGLEREFRRGEWSMRRSARSGAIRSLLAPMMLALLSGCASAGSSSSTSSSTPAAADSTAPASSQAFSSTTTTPASRRASPGPLQTVEHYWRAISSQNFEAALLLL
jgi:hypothetical protein